MEREEYEEWVEYIDQQVGIPRVVCSKDDYGQDWIKEFTVAQFLSRSFDKHEPSFKLIKQIINRDLECKHDNSIDNCLECIEQKAWLFKDLGWLYWKVDGDAEKALEYTKHALDVAQSVDEQFLVLVRGEIFIQKLRCLKVLGRTEEALEEANKKIELMKEEMPEMKLNSYLFYSYLFKAQVAEERDNWKQAANYLRQALEHQELLRGEKTKIDELWDNYQDDYQELYKQLTRFRRTNVVWEI